LYALGTLCSFKGRVHISQEKYRGPHLLVRFSVNRFVSRQIETMREKIKANAQKLRKRALKNLEEFRVNRKSDSDKFREPGNVVQIEKRAAKSLVLTRRCSLGAFGGPAGI
jgi:hypothetical protein